MATRTFVKDPETGALSVQVSSYQRIELDQLARIQEEAQQAVDAKEQEVAENTQKGKLLAEQLGTLETQLSDAKSEYESAKAVVEQPAEGLDAGAAGSGSPDADPDSDGSNEQIADL
jgi:ABC-type transporter Mla subunit MlaD